MEMKVSSDDSLNTIQLLTNSQNEVNKPAAQEEYDPSQPLDSSDDEDQDYGILQLEKESNDPISDSIEHPPQPEVTKQPASKAQAIVNYVENLQSCPPTRKDPDIDLNSIPMPSDEYRRPTIQFSIPTRHRLMSISSLIKRQKGVVKKSDKGNGSGLCYNSEVSKAFNQSDCTEEIQSDSQDAEDDRPRISLVQEIFGSDDEETPREEQQESESLLCGSEILNNNCTQSEMDSAPLVDVVLSSSYQEDRWKTIVDENSVPHECEGTVDELFPGITNDFNSPLDNPLGPKGSSEEMTISIKPPSELFAAPNEESSPEPTPLELDTEPIEEEERVDDTTRGKENKQIILECISDDDSDFEVTFVGIGRANLADLRQGRLSRRNQDRSIVHSSGRRKSVSPINGFEEGEIVDPSERKKKKPKKRKTKKRKRSKDSRSSKINSERSTGDSAEKKSFSESDNGKEISWRKPKMTKSRNYRNGKRESEEKLSNSRFPKNDETNKKSRSPNRNVLKSKSRRNRSISSGRHKSKSLSKSPVSRWRNRSRGKRTRRGSSLSNFSSPSHSRSRSLTKRRPKRRHSPSPVRKHRRSITRSPIRFSSSPTRSGKRNRSTEKLKHERNKNRSRSPDAYIAKKSSCSKAKKDEVPVEDTKRRKKEKSISEDIEKEKKKKKKKREKSLSPVKAIVADGDSIVVSLSFQKTKEEVAKPPKTTPSSNSDQAMVSSETAIHSSSNTNDNEIEDSKQMPEACNKIVSGRGTILINLSASPCSDIDILKSSETDKDHGDGSVTKPKKSHDEKKRQDPKEQEGISESSDVVSSSHDDSNINTQTKFLAGPETGTITPTEGTKNTSAKSPFRLSELFSSSYDSTKSTSPAIDRPSPVSSDKQNESSTELNTPQKSSHSSSPFNAPQRTSTSSITTENGHEKQKTPSPEVLQMTINRNFNAPVSKPMIGNIPGLFPSGFVAGPGGIPSTPSVVIPPPPRIIPNSSSSSMINQNVLVTVASALYAPLLAAKQHNTSNAAGQMGLQNFSRNAQSGLFSNPHHHPSSHSTRNNNGSGDQRDGDSPFSPNSSDGDDLFEPPSDGNNGMNVIMNNKKGQGTDSNPRKTASTNSTSPTYGKFSNEGSSVEKRSLFDTLFSTAPSKSSLGGGAKHGRKRPSVHPKRGKTKKVTKLTAIEKNGDGDMNLRLSEDVPNSAVSLRINEKYLKKLNRQERVVEEVKLSLKPHYSKKHITKDQYKDILRKAVPKICHNKSGEINPHKIKELIEAYVKKFRKTRKLDKK